MGTEMLRSAQHDSTDFGRFMIFTNQERECVVTLSGAKGLARWAQRCFAALILRGVYPERSEWAQHDSTDFGR